MFGIKRETSTSVGSHNEPLQEQDDQLTLQVQVTSNDYERYMRSILSL